MGPYFETVISKQTLFVSPNEQMDEKNKTKRLSILGLSWSSEMSVSEMYESAMTLKCITLERQIHLSEQLTRTVECSQMEMQK